MRLGAGAQLTSTHIAGTAPTAQSKTKSAPRLFNHLIDSEVDEVMKAGVVRRFAAGQTIIRADDPGTHLFLIRAGSVDFYRITPEGQQVLIMRLSPNTSFGLVTLLAEPMTYIGTAESIVETELHVWEHSWVRRLAAKHPVLTENALRIGLEFIRVYSDRHLALVSDDADSRLRRTLSLLGGQAGHQHSKGLEVQITNERLASLADINYFTTSRILNKWQRKGALEKSRGKILILSPETMLS